MDHHEQNQTSAEQGHKLQQALKIDTQQVQTHLDSVVRQSVEETINGLLDAEAEQLCNAGRYERSAERQDTRAGHYKRKLHTKAGEVTVKMPKLRSRPIEGKHPYVYLDGIWLKRSWGGEVKNVSVLVAIGVDQDGYRQVLGVSEGAKEDHASWLSFLRHLKERGLDGVRLVISDACLGLVEALGEVLPAAQWQRCITHFYRNVTKHVPSGKMKDAAAMLKAIHAQEDAEAAQKKANDVIAKLEAMKLGQAAAIVRDGVADTLAYMQFPREHRLRIRTNNPLERVMKEIRRRTRVVGAFPDGKSALMLVAARLRHVAGTRWGTRRYLDMDRLYEQERAQAEEAVEPAA